MEDASAPEVAGGRVHTVYGGEANTVCELKDLNAPIGIEGEPMQGPAAYDSAKDMAYVGRVADRRRRTMDEVSIKDRCACKGNCGDETCTGTQFETCDGKKANGHQRKREAEQFCRKCCTASARIQITNTPLPPKYPEAPWCKVQGHDKVISPLHGKGKDYADKGDSEGKGACNDHKAKGYYEGKGAGTRNSSSSKGWNGPRNQQIMIMGVDNSVEGTGFQEQRPLETQFQLIVDLTRKSNEHLDHLRSQQLLIETLRDKVNELETKIDDIHNFMHSEAVVTLLPGVTLRVDEAAQTDREDEEWKGSRGPARRGSNESAIAEP